MKKRISVVIPVGPGKEINVALESLKKQEEKVDVFVEIGLNTSENRNKGIGKAKTKIIAFVNGHTILPKNWSKQIREFFEEHPEIDIVGGPQLTPENDTKFGRVSGYALSSIFGAAGSSTRYKIRDIIFDADERYLTSSNLACRATVFKKVMFSENIYPGEDPKFIADVKDKNFKVAYSPDIISYNKRRANLDAFAKQIFSYGLTRPKKEKLIETLKHPSFLVPSIFVLYLCIFNFLILIHWIFIIPILLYFFLNISFSFFESIKHNELVNFFTLSFLFFTIHISYGLGFLLGTFKNFHKNKV